MNTPQIVERRKNPTSDHAIMLEIVKQTRDDVHELKTKLEEHIEMEAVMTATLVKDLLGKSFPEGDPNMHRIYHENLIKAAEDRAALMRDLRSSVAKWGIVGLLAWATHHLWIDFLMGPGK